MFAGLSVCTVLIAKENMSTGLMLMSVGLGLIWIAGARLQDLAKAGKLHAYRHEGFWQPMDTMVEFQYLNKVWAEGKAPWKVW